MPPPPTVRSAARGIREGSSSPRELFDRAVARIRAADPVVRAFVAFDEEQARADAEELSREAARGDFRGPLHGVPIAVKDVIDVRGLPTRGGSLVTDDTPAAEDAPAVRRLREAGALLLGKTTTHEFAHGVTTPPTRNPWAVDRIPGGSSGGSAAAVATGQCLAALGSDTGGSIRVPASLCGVSGLRPRPGDVPTAGILPFSPRLDTCGPLARDVADLAVLFEVLSGRRCRPGSGADRLRIGSVPAEALGEVDDEVAAAVDAAVRLLAGAGATVTPVAVPPFDAWSAPRGTFVLADFLDVHRRAGWYPVGGTATARRSPVIWRRPSGSPARSGRRQCASSSGWSEPCARAWPPWTSPSFRPPSSRRPRSLPASSGPTIAGAPRSWGPS